jgi:hypothetical protein
MKRIKNRAIFCRYFGLINFQLYLGENEVEMRKNLKTILLTIFFCIGTSSIFMVVSAQPTDPCQTDNPDNPSPECIPIDGGLLLLLAAGAGYGIRKSRLDRYKHQEGTEEHS